MQETQKHRDVFEEFYKERNILAVARKTGISRQSLGNWKKEFKWKQRCEDRDREVNDRVNDVMVPQWVAVKITLVQAFINQINEGLKLKIAPENSRDMVAISRELRALLGESDKHEVEFTGIEYVLKEVV